MNTPTLALGISAAGAQQVADLAAAVAALKTNLVQLGQTAGGNSLGNLDKLTSEFQAMRQELVQSVQGLRTDLAAGFNQAFTAAAQQVKAGGSKVEDEVKASAARIKSASKEMDLGLSMETAVAKYRSQQDQQIADTIAFEGKQKTAWVSYKDALNARLADEATAMDYAVAQYRVLQDRQVADQIAFEEKQKAAWVAYQDDLDKRLALEATAMEGAAAQFRAIQAQQIADQTAFETKQAALFYASQAAMEKQAAAAAALAVKGAARQTGEIVGDFSSILPATYGQLKQVDSAAKSFTETLANLQPTSRSTREALSMVTEGIQGRFKNLGGSIVAMLNALGLAPFIINPVTIGFAAAAAAAVTFTVAVEKGQTELKNFENEATITGNAIGISSSRFTQLRDSLTSVSVTKGAATDALDAIAKSGLLASENVGQIATTAILMKRAVDQPLAETIKQFTELGKSPAEAAAKLNDQYHFLTASIYDQINALEQHGQKQAAADLAEKTYAEEMSKRSQAILDNLGTLQSAWYGLGNMARSAWDKMLDVGRQQSAGDKLKEASDAVTELQRKIASRGLTVTSDGGAAFGGRVSGGSSGDQQRLLDAEEEMKSALRTSEIQGTQVTLRDQINKQAEAAVTWDKQGNTLQRTRLGLEAQVAATRTNGLAAGRSELEIEQRIALLRERYKRGNGGIGTLATSQANGVNFTEEANSYRQKTAALDAGLPGDSIDTITNSEKEYNKIEAQIALTTDAAKKAILEKAAAVAQANIPLEKAANDAKAAFTSDEKYYKQLSDGNDKIRQRVAALAEQNANTGKNAIETAKVQLADAQFQVTMDQILHMAPAQLAYDQQRVDLLTQLVAQLGLAGVKTQELKLADEQRQNAAQTQELQIQLETLGKTADARAVILAQKKADLDLSKQLAAIDAIDTGGDPDNEAKKAKLRLDAQEAARVKAVNASDKKILDEWQKTADSIENSLEAALMNGFKNGKGFVSSFRDWIKAQFESLVLKMIVQPIMAPIAGGLASTVLGVQGVNTGGVGGTLSTLGSLGSSASTLSSIGSGVSSLGSMVGSGMGVSNIAGTLFANATTTGAGTALDGLLATNAAYGTAAVGTTAAAGGIGAGISTALAAIPVWGWVALAAIAVASIFGGKGGGPKQDGVSSAYTGSLGLGQRSAASDGAASSAASSIQNAYNTLVTQAGGVANMQFGVGYSMDPKGTSQSFVGITGSQNGVSVYDDTNLQAGRSTDDLTKAITDMSNKAILEGLQKSNLQSALGSYLTSLGDIAKMSATDAQAALTRVQNALTQKSQIDTQIFNLTHTQDEVLARNRAAELAGIDDTNKALQQRLYALEDEATALQTLNSALTAAGQLIANVNSSIRTYLDKLNATPAGMLTPAEQLSNAKLQFQQQLTLARAGDATALQGITGYADQLISAQKAYSASGTETSTMIAAVKQQLAGLPQMQTTEQELAAIARNTGATVSGLKDATDKIWDGLWGSAGMLSTQFTQLDVNNSGSLSFDELKTALGPLASDATIHTLISRVDTDGNGQISRLEAINAGVAEATAQQLITSQSTAAAISATVTAAGNSTASKIVSALAPVAGTLQYIAGSHDYTVAGNYLAGSVSGSFAQGGIMSPSGPLPLRTYARGGIANSPQLAMFGEGSMNEAYVPLPDGHRIPVNMGGQGALVAEIKALRAEVAKLRQIAQTGNQIAAMGAKGTINAVGEVVVNTSNTSRTAKLVRAAAPVGKAAKV